MKMLAAVLLIAALPACTTTLQGQESSAGGTTATMVSTTAIASGSNYAVGATFARPAGALAAGANLSVSTSSAAAALLIGVVIVNAIDYLSGGPAGGAAAGMSANRPIMHTCSCYGYRPDQDPPPPRE